MLLSVFEYLRSAAVMAAMTVLMMLMPLSAKSQDWSGQITLYGWGAGVTGDFRPLTGAPTLSFDKSLSEILEDLDAAFFVTGLARRGNLVLFGDFTYTSSSRAGVVPPGIPASGALTIRSLTLAAGRRFDVGTSATVDLLGGLRAWSIDGRISSPVLRIAPESNFVDPILGLRANASLSDRWSLLGYIDIGGFGFGSDFTWQAALTANYKVSNNLYLSAGWRHLHLDFSDDSMMFDGAMAGPVVGATWRF